MSNICEEKMELPAEHERNVFGQFDEHVKKLERTLGVTVISRDGQIKILGPKPSCDQAVKILKEFLELSQRGNTITQQNVNYALSLAMEEKTSAITEIDRDCICHTLNGRPIKPKTLGQKAYVDEIRKKMIVFGMALQEREKRIWLWLWLLPLLKMTKWAELFSPVPPLKPGRNWAFCRGICRARLTLTCVLSMTPCTKSWEPKALPKTWKRG